MGWVILLTNRDSELPTARIPRDKGLDSTLALLTEGYTFIAKRCRHYRSDIFQTRLMLQRFICMIGEAAARVFYDTDRFERRRAAPSRLQKTLFGRGGVQELDDDAHRWRKQMFLALMTPAGIKQLADLTTDQWHISIDMWETMDLGWECIQFCSARWGR